MQLVVAVANNLRGSRGLVGRRRGLLQEIAVSVIRVGDGAGLWVLCRQQSSQRIVSKCANAPLSRVGSAPALLDTQQIVQRVIAVIGDERSEQPASIRAAGEGPAG